MTPQERQLIDELFERLATLEGKPRDPQAERAIAEGLARAPHAIYPLVQTLLIQEEALRRADARIRELSGDGDGEQPQEERGFLDSMRDALLGREEPRRGSVPLVRPGGMPPQPASYAGQQGGSFLGTAAATAAGVIGGALLLDSIRSMMGGGQAQASPSALGETGKDSPWTGGTGDSDLARQAGIEDIGRSHDERQGWFDTAQRGSDEDFGGDGGFDIGGDGGGSD